jgi:hypothetical protein
MMVILASLDKYIDIFTVIFILESNKRKISSSNSTLSSTNHLSRFRINQVKNSMILLCVSIVFEMNLLFALFYIVQDKSGMGGIDAERVNQIIYEASKGSKYFKNVIEFELTINVNEC